MRCSGSRRRTHPIEVVQKVIIRVIASEAKQSEPLNFPRNVRLLRHFVIRDDAFGDFLDSLVGVEINASAPSRRGRGMSSKGGS